MNLVPWKEFHYPTLVMMSNLKYTDMRLKENIEKIKMVLASDVFSSLHIKL